MAHYSSLAQACPVSPATTISRSSCPCPIAPCLSEQATSSPTLILRPYDPHSSAHAMTIGLLPSRALALRLLSRGPATPVLFTSVRVRHDQNAGHPTSTSHSNAGPIHSCLGQSHNYATAAPASRPGRPKAHTGRATAPKRKATATTRTATSAAPKPAAARKSAANKKAAKPKRKVKAKAKPTRKPKTRVLTEHQKATKEKKANALKKRELRIRALLTPPAATPPKMLPQTAYMVINRQNQVKGIRSTENAKANAAKYKALTPEEREVRRAFQRP